MNLSRALISSTLIVFGALAVASGAQHAASDVAALQQAQDRVARFAATSKGGVQGRLLLEEQRIQGLIDDLESGKAVDPADIDRALQRAVNP